MKNQKKLIIAERKVDIMKKRYRIGICLTLVICLLFLSACRGAPLNDSTPTIGETAATQPSENIAETNSTQSTTSPEDNKSNLPETLTFHWENSFLQVIGDLGLNDIKDAKQVTYEELKNNMVARAMFYDIDNPDGYYQKALVAATYPEEFYKNHTLIVIPVKAVNAALEITDVQYANGVLKCSVKTWHRPEGEPFNWSPDHFYLGWRFYCFVELDTVLPEGTQIVCDFTEERLSSADYRVKLDSFKDKCLFYAYLNTAWD